jgi:hypothetical protein
MAVVLPGWFDDSERDDDEHAVQSVGGCVGTVAQWEVQDSAWIADVLVPFGLTEVGFHMKEMKSPKGPYAQFKDNPAQTLKLSEAVIGTFKKSQVRPIASIARLNDSRRFNEERKRGLNPYALNIYACMFLTRQCFRIPLIGDSVAHLWLDKSGSFTGPACDCAVRYAQTDRTFSDLADRVFPSPMPKARLARTTPALQAADFVAWEQRYFIQEYRDFYDARPLGESKQDLRTALTKWAAETGRTYPFKRGSMRAFMLGTLATSFAWTLNVLCEFDDARGGVWEPGKAKKRRPSAGQLP